MPTRAHGNRFREHRGPAAVPELVLAGTNGTIPADLGPLGVHKHIDAELHYVESGAAQWRIGADNYDIGGGQAFIAQPDQPHGGAYGFLSPCRVYWARIVVNPTERFLGLPSDESAVLLQRIRESAHTPILVGTRPAELFHTILDGLASPQDPLAVTNVRSCLLSLLLLIVQAADATTRKPPTPVVAAARKLMHDELHTPLTLPEIARRLGYSTSYLKRCFRAETGVSPADYYLRRRIDRAMRLLLEEDARPVTDVALSLGFSSAQNFSVSFRRVVGMTPTRFRSVAGDPDAAPAFYWEDDRTLT